MSSDCTFGWLLANGEEIKVNNLTVPPFEVVPIIIKRICAKYFDDCIIFKGVPQALKFNIENAMACITSQVYFREISFSSWNNMVDKGHGYNDNIYLRYLYSVIYKKLNK